MRLDVHDDVDGFEVTKTHVNRFVIAIRLDKINLSPSSKKQRAQRA